MNIIKSTGKTVAALALAFSITACGNDWLDREPGTGLPEERALTNSESLNNARIGLYNALKGRLLWSYILRLCRDAWRRHAVQLEIRKH